MNILFTAQERASIFAVLLNQRQLEEGVAERVAAALKLFSRERPREDKEKSYVSAAGQCWMCGRAASGTHCAKHLSDAVVAASRQYEFTRDMLSTMANVEFEIAATFRAAGWHQQADRARVMSKRLREAFLLIQHLEEEEEQP